MHDNPFSAEEIARRLEAVRHELAQRGLDAAVFASPENVFYLTGLDHWGYFAPHLLVVPVADDCVLVTRTMECVSVEKQVRGAQFRGHADSETAADMMARVLHELKLAGKPLGIERWTSGMSFGLGQSLEAQVPARWSDVSGLADTLRLVKSAEEQALMRRAATISCIAARAAIDAIKDGAHETDVAAACIAAMTKAGGHPPGFGPFIRPGSRLGEEHATWGEGTYHADEPVFLELSACVSRYHAPLGRLVHMKPMNDADARMAGTGSAPSMRSSRRSSPAGARRTSMRHGRQWSTMRGFRTIAGIIAAIASASACHRHGRAAIRSWASGTIRRSRSARA